MDHTVLPVINTMPAFNYLTPHTSMVRKPFNENGKSADSTYFSRDSLSHTIG